MSSSQITVKQLIEKMQAEESFPAISQNITELNSKAAPTSESSANELATLILRDYSLTSRLLKVANSAMYGQFSGTISTVSRAVVVLGFEQVQLTAAGLIFFEHLQDKAKSHYIKEAVLSAFLSGILARDLAKTLNLKNWENFYIGAMFHNFGQLLAMYYFPTEFARYEQLLKTEQIDKKTACERALGVPFADLGIGVAKTWSLPDQIVVSLKSTAVPSLEGKTEKVNHQQVLPRFANELCEITMNVPQKERVGALQKLLEKYRKIYPVNAGQVTEMMEVAIKEMKRFTEVLKLNRADLQRLEQRSLTPEEKAAPAAQTTQISEAEAKVALNRFAIATPDHQGEVITTAEQRKVHLQEGIQELTNVMLDDFSLDEVLSMILETVFRGIGFDRVVIFFKDPKAQQMLARYALGANTAGLVRDFKFPMGGEQRDLFNMSLHENKDLYISNISDPEIHDFKPDWFCDAIFSPSFALYPIVINKKAIGMIYGGHNQPGHHLNTEQLNAMKTLRNQAALAIKQCFAG